MTEPKFTPGPWWPFYSRHVDSWYVMTGRDDADACHYGDRLGATIASGIGDHTEQRTSGNERENAYLIAAAPDLYHALDSLMSELDCHSSELDCLSEPTSLADLLADRLGKKFIDAKFAALAKARGEEG